jgi:hypothetical protein
MAGLRGNQASLQFEKQSARGTPAALGATSDRVPFTGGNIQPSRSVASLSETDANRDQGISYVEVVGVEGSPEFYARDSNIHHALEAVLGATAVTGAGPNYTHTITPANALAYYTFYRELGGTLFEKFTDCQVSEATISADAGSPLTVGLSIVGRQAERLAAAPAAQPALASDAVYNFNEAAVTLAGGATSLVSSFELTISNNVTSQQTDDVVPYDVVPGVREVSLGFTLIFENLTEYNKFHYGGAAGTTQSASLATTSAVFTFAKSASNEISFTLPEIAYQDFPVEPDAGGDPVTVDVRAVAQRGASPVVTAVVKNQEAT